MEKDETRHNFREKAIEITEDSIKVNLGSTREELWTFAIVRKCSQGGETVSGLDRCLKPREFEPRLRG